MVPKNATQTPSVHYAEMAAWAAENIPETAGFYILHFDAEVYDGKPGSTLGLAGHYCGSAANLRARFLQHLGGCGKGGSRLCEVANERGIRFWMVRAFQTSDYEAAYAYEQYFKKHAKNSRRCCPQCEGRKLPCPTKKTLETK